VLSYYLTGLAGYVFKALSLVMHLPARPELLAALTIPVWIVSIWAFTRRVNRMVRRALKQK
jgi:uncharacterized membrane-anchored protein